MLVIMSHQKWRIFKIFPNHRYSSKNPHQQQGLEVEKKHDRYQDRKPLDSRLVLESPCTRTNNIQQHQNLSTNLSSDQTHHNINLPSSKVRVDPNKEAKGFLLTLLPTLQPPRWLVNKGNLSNLNTLFYFRLASTRYKLVSPKQNFFPGVSATLLVFNPATAQVGFVGRTAPRKDRVRELLLRCSQSLSGFNQPMLL